MKNKNQIKSMLIPTADSLHDLVFSLIKHLIFIVLFNSKFSGEENEKLAKPQPDVKDETKRSLLQIST